MDNARRWRISPWKLKTRPNVNPRNEINDIRIEELLDRLKTPKQREKSVNFKIGH